MAPLKEERGHRFSIAGPPVDLPPTTAVPMAMILHELCTNALKYGALSNDEGRVTIRWTTTPDERGTAIKLSWSEKTARQYKLLERKVLAPGLSQV